MLLLTHPVCIKEVIPETFLFFVCFSICFLWLFRPTVHAASRHGTPSLTSLPKDDEVSCEVRPPRLPIRSLTSLDRALLQLPDENLLRHSATYPVHCLTETCHTLWCICMWTILQEYFQLQCIWETVHQEIFSISRLSTRLIFPCAAERLLFRKQCTRTNKDV